jgi:hypothetical protein
MLYTACRLLERPSVLLFPNGNVDLDAAWRFCERFRAAWSRLPVPLPAIIAAHWARRCDSPTVWYCGGPLGTVPPYDTAWGMCGDDGHELYFLAPAVESLSDPLAEAICGHELGHVLAEAVGWNGDEDLESTIDSWVRAWGLPIDDARAAFCRMERRLQQRRARA